MSAPLVSVIIPTFNRAHSIHHTIDSVLAQTYPGWEVIVVDDGSSDGTAQIIAGRYGSDRRIRYIYQDNAGVSAARNRGLAAAQGDYVALLDSDDRWEPWKLELQLACFACNPEIGMVWTDMAAINPAGEIVNPRYLKTMYSAYGYFGEGDLFTRTLPVADIAPGISKELPAARLFTGEIFSQMIMGNLVHTSTVMLSRERLRLVGGFRLDLLRSGEDYDFHLRTCREGPVGFVDAASVQYQIGMPDQLTERRYHVDLAQNFLKTIEPVIARDRPRIKLPERMIRHTLAYGHQWLGQELLMSGNPSKARPHLAESLREEWNFRTAGLYTLSLLPTGSIDRLRSARHTCQTWPVKSMCKVIAAFFGF